MSEAPVTPLTFDEIIATIARCKRSRPEIPVKLEVSPQMWETLLSKADRLPPSGFTFVGLEVEVDPNLRFDPEVFRVVYADGHKEIKAPDDHPIFGNTFLSGKPRL